MQSRAQQVIGLHESLTPGPAGSGVRHIIFQNDLTELNTSSEEMPAKGCTIAQHLSRFPVLSGAYLAASHDLDQEETESRKSSEVHLLCNPASMTLQFGQLLLLLALAPRINIQIGPGHCLGQPLGLPQLPASLPAAPSSTLRFYQN